MTDMKRFNALKKVNAKPMTRQAYNDLRGWEVPVDEYGGDDGYLTVDLNSDSNLDGYEGYVSWTPKAMFDDQFYEADDDTPTMCDSVLGGDVSVGCYSSGLSLDQELMRETISLISPKYADARTDQMIDDANKIVSAILGSDSRVADAAASAPVPIDFNEFLAERISDALGVQVDNCTVMLNGSNKSADLRNKVTIDDLNALVDSGHTEYNHLAGTLTHCTITLPCGFKVTGESACIDPNIYDEELGREIARKKAVNELWPLEGYLLANDRYRAELASKAKEGNSYEDNASCSECKRSYLS